MNGIYVDISLLQLIKDILYVYSIWMSARRDYCKSFCVHHRRSICFVLLLAAVYKDGRCAGLEKLGFYRRPSSDTSRHISLGLMTTLNEY